MKRQLQIRQYKSASGGHVSLEEDTRFIFMAMPFDCNTEAYTAFKILLIVDPHLEVNLGDMILMLKKKLGPDRVTQLLGEYAKRKCPKSTPARRSTVGDTDSDYIFSEWDDDSTK